MNLSERLAKAIYEAEGDEEKKDKPEEIEDIETDEDEDLGAGDDEDPDFGEEDGGDEEDADLGDSEFGDEEEDPDPELEGIDDFQIEDSSDLGDEFNDEEGGEGDGMGDEDDLDIDSLLSNDPPAMDEDPFADDGVEASSDFRQFITNQLIDFPVEDVRFVEEEGRKYVDAKFGDKAVSFALYNGDDGQPLLAILHGDEVYRTELAPEAVSGDGMVRDEFMPIEFIRDMLARIVDVAPEFECFRFKKRGMDCNEVRRVMVKVQNFGEKAVKMAEACKSIKAKALAKPKSSRTNKVVKGGTNPAKKADLGAKGKRGHDVPSKSGGKVFK